MAVPKDDAKSPQPEATLRIILRDGSVVEREITKSEVTIGKGPQNDVILADASVSARMLSSRFEDGAYKISDLGSRNGTLVNDARLGAESRAIQHGDLIKMGHCALTFPAERGGRHPGNAAAHAGLRRPGTWVPPPAYLFSWVAALMKDNRPPRWSLPVW